MESPKKLPGPGIPESTINWYGAFVEAEEVAEAAAATVDDVAVAEDDDIVTVDATIEDDVVDCEVIDVTVGVAIGDDNGATGVEDRNGVVGCCSTSPERRWIGDEEYW